MSISSLILKKITNKLPRVKCKSQWGHLEGLQLGDPTFHLPSHIDILLGAGAAAEIMLPGIRHGPSGSPSAQNTKFGWMLSGNVRQNSSSHSISVQTHHASCNLTEPCLDSTISKFWELEEPDGSEMSRTEEEEACLEHFQNTHERDEDGRYSVELPFKQESSTLGQSRHLALRRFYRVEKRLSQNPVIKQEYIKCMRESIESNFLELVPLKEIQKSEVYYMPHREVIKESSSSTKVRIVYDASAKSSSGVSLNDVLMTGPKLQVDLVPLLIQFRSYRVAMSADIVKFYPQFKVKRNHIDFQRLVWREDEDSPILDYRMLRVTFGVTSASFLAIRCLQQLADDEKEFPRAAEVIKTGFLVDNLLSGSDDLESALILQQEFLEIMERGKLQLSKWASNNPHVIQAVPPNQRESSFPLVITEDEAVKTIGLLWNPSINSFGVSVNVPDLDSTTTKRKILSSIAKTFDPLGWLSPVTIRAKIIMQALWKLKVDWDTPLPVQLTKQWTDYCQDLVLLKSFRISRCIVGPSHPSVNLEYELHGFSDASHLAHSACIYLRTLGGPETFVNLIVAKTKVCPVKAETIPRLELCGAELLSKLLKTVQKSLNIQFRATRCWTDSTIVLDWLASKEKQPVFIANRIRKIISIIPSINWFHVSGIDNPADAASRGISTKALLSSKLWLQGPFWLSDLCYLVLPVSSVPASDPSETVSHSVILQQSTLTNLIKKVESFSKLKRIVAYCLRFIRNLKPAHPLISGFLSVEELNRALIIIVSCVQRESFDQEIRQVQSQLPLKSPVKFLTPYLDQDGLLRVGGRLDNSALSKFQKHPLLLPRHHPFTDSVVRYFHLLHLHAGPQLLLAIIRQQFWIIRGPDVVKRIVRNCIVCHRQNKMTSQQLMGQLPSPRVNPSRPFSKSGMDYAGPFVLCHTPGRKPKLSKYYVSVFVCMATRAIHLELVGDLSTPSFIGALTRFISRRGLPTDLYSDGGKNFIGAKTEMAEFSKFINSTTSQTHIHEFLTSKAIRYHVNPPLSPHHGGLWEAGVKAMKHHLKRVVENRHLSIEEFTTLLCQVEACLNSRPLTQMSMDPNDFTVLTPGHFLMGESPLAMPQHDLVELNSNRLSRWQLVQQMFQHFWKRWNSEYLQSLQCRPKWFQPQPNLDVGVLVLIRDDDIGWGPLKWKLGRITAVYPGRDGKVRVCDVKTAAGPVYKRPIVNLSPLPIYS